MDDIGKGGDDAGEKAGAVKGRTTATKFEEQKRNYREAGYGIAKKVLGPRIVEAVEIVLEERWSGPNHHGRENCRITSSERITSLGCHLIQTIGSPHFDLK